MPYLVSKYAKEDSLYPKNLIARARVDQRLHFDTSILFGAIKSFVVGTNALNIIFYSHIIFNLEFDSLRRRNGVQNRKPWNDRPGVWFDGVFFGRRLSCGKYNDNSGYIVRFRLEHPDWSDAFRWGQISKTDSMDG